MANIVPSNRNKNLESFSPYQIMRNFFQEPFFGDFGILSSSFGGIRADVKDMGNEYIVEAELPGVSKDRINLDIHDGLLTISANEEVEQKQEQKDYVYRERRYGHVSRSFPLDNINENAIKAEYRDGLLFVHMPKSEQAKKSSRKIEIH